MASRSGGRRVDPGSPLVDLDVVFADDAEVDRICHRADDAGRAGHRRGAPSADPLMDLFRTWREELTAVPLPPAPDVRQAFDGTDHRGAGQRGVGQRGVGQHGPPRKRSVRSVLAVAAAIAALLVGSATVGSRHATPDSALWAVTQVLWPDRAESVTSRQNVQDALHQAEVALATGRTQEAQLALLRAAVELGKVDDMDGRVDMQGQVDHLWRVAAPQELSSTSLAPELYAGEPDSSGAVPVTPSSASARRIGVTAAASSSKPGTAPSTASAAAGSVTAPAVTPGPVALGPAESSPTVAGQLPPAAGDPGTVSGQPATTPAGIANNAAAPAPAPTLQSSSSAPPAAPAPPAVPLAPSPLPAVPSPAVPANTPSTAPALTPPPPSPADPSSESTSPGTTTSAAPPAPAPAPVPTDTSLGPQQTTPDTTGTDASSSGQQVSADSATADTAPAT